MTTSGIFLLVADPKNPFPNGVECQWQAGNAGDLIAEGGATLAEYKTDADGYASGRIGEITATITCRTRI